MLNELAVEETYPADVLSDDEPDEETKEDET